MDKNIILQSLAVGIRQGSLTFENVPQMYKEEVANILEKMIEAEKSVSL